LLRTGLRRAAFDRVNDAVCEGRKFKGKAVVNGDSMLGIDECEGGIEKTGNYKIKVAIASDRGFTANHRLKKKPASANASRVQLK